VTAVVANANGAAWTTTGPNGGCSAADFTVSPVTIAAGDVLAGATVDGTVTIQMINRNVNQDDCKSLTSVPLYFVAS
jgi:hypothetical protein